MTAVAFILKGYPRLSETFIAQEILELERRGLDLRIVSLRRPTDAHTHAVHREISAPVTYLPEYLREEPGRAATAVRAARRLPGYRAARAAWLGDLRRDLSRNRIRRFGQACVLAHELGSGLARLHAHFLHTPASVARYAATMLDVPWSCSAHAKDIWTTPDWEIREKLADLDWAVTCTRAGIERLRALAPTPEKVGLVYHGIDLSRFPPPAADRPMSDGSRQDIPVIVLSVGRAVEKKGYGDLLDALALLPKGLSWRFRHIGGGAMMRELQARAGALGIAERVDWLGAQPQERVLEEMRRSDLFVLASKVAGDGDRDGLPNVLMEANSQGLAVVATRVSGIPELVVDGRTGVLTEPDDPDELFRALNRLILNPNIRRQLGRAGTEHVRESFSLSRNIGGIAARFGLPAESKWAAACE